MSNKEPKETKEIKETKVAKEAKENISSFMKSSKGGRVLNGTAMEQVTELFSYASKMRTSDVHIDPWRDAYVVRMRIDGVMKEVLKLNRDTGLKMVGRIKVLSRLRSDITQFPQDGRIDGTSMSVRVSTIPSIYGESVVLRMLPLEKKVETLESLGYNKDFILACEGWAKSPYGLAIISGPTGSGKTTALYSILSMVDTNKKVVVSIEDPVERHIENVRQLQVSKERGFTYPVALRHVMRQDPDIIMIGEIRDAETANIAVHAALTGHLVIATLHADSAHAIPLRLSALGILPHYMSHAISLLASIRLVRRLCLVCKNKEFKKESNNNHNLNQNHNQNHDCKKCGGSGYFGRAGISEHVKVDEKIKEKLDLSGKLEQKNFISLLDDAIEKVKSGITDIEEAERVLGKLK